MYQVFFTPQNQAASTKHWVLFGDDFRIDLFCFVEVWRYITLRYHNVTYDVFVDNLKTKKRMIVRVGGVTQSPLVWQDSPKLPEEAMSEKTYQAGVCFAAAYDMARRHPMKYPAGNVWVCHGIAALSRPPYSWFGHAWLEVQTSSGVMVSDPKYPERQAPKALYYEIGRIQIETVYRYDWRIIKRKVEAEGHYGPYAAEIARVTPGCPEYDEAATVTLFTSPVSSIGL